MAREEADALRRERDLYARLLELTVSTDLDSLLSDALLAAVRRVGAQRGYLAIYADTPTRGGAPRWWRAFGCDDLGVQAIQEAVSRTIIEDTFKRRQVLLVPSALGHPRYARARSVQANQITSVVCAPVGADGRGILYLQERRGGGVFLLEHETFIVRLGELIGPAVDRLVATHDDADGGDPTAPWRRGGRFTGVVGRSEALGRALKRVFRAAQHQDSVLLSGPRGSGKTLLARALHEQGLSPDGPFVHVPCAALEGDGRADLLGDASGVRAGLVEVAQGGTLYLHHVERLPLAAQQVVVELVEGRAVRLGPREPARPELRVVASTVAGLSGSGDTGAILPALRDRLEATLIEVPGLDERPEDVELHLTAVGRRVAARHHLRWHGFSEQARSAALAHPWSQHVRELETLVTQAVTRVDGQLPIGAEDLFPTTDDAPPAPAPALLLQGPLRPWREAKKAFEAAYIAHALAVHEGNVTGTARTLQVSRSRLFALLNERGLREEDDDPDLV